MEIMERYSCVMTEIFYSFENTRENFVTKADPARLCGHPPLVPVIITPLNVNHYKRKILFYRRGRDGFNNYYGKYVFW
jgi:hypothetical protein